MDGLSDDVSPKLGPSSDAKMTPIAAADGVCKVCQALASGIHYGVATCEGEFLVSLRNFI